MVQFRKGGRTRMQAMEIGRFKLVPVVRAHVSPGDVSVNCVRVLGG